MRRAISMADSPYAGLCRSRLSRGTVSGRRAKSHAYLLAADLSPPDRSRSGRGDRRGSEGVVMSERDHIDWLRERLAASRAIEPRDPAELLAWLDARRAEVPFAAELIPLREVANWRQDADGNFQHDTGQFFRIEGVRVTSAPGLREVSGWDQPILTQTEGGVLALLAREVEGRGVEFLLQAKADPGNVGHLQLCPTIQSTWENIRGLKGAGRAPLIEYLEPSDNVRVIYRA